MNPEAEKQVYEVARDALGELMGPIFSAADTMTDWPGGQAAALREIATACSPQTHRAAMRRLCDKFEQLVDGSVSGSFLQVVEQEIDQLCDILDELRRSSTESADFLEPYAGFRGSVRLALELGTKPWNFLVGFAGKDPFQMRRAELQCRHQVAFERFNDATMALILTLESALSRHTGNHFSFRDAFDRTKSTAAGGPSFSPQA
jgi:hypothetical protein